MATSDTKDPRKDKKRRKRGRPAKRAIKGVETQRLELKKRAATLHLAGLDRNNIARQLGIGTATCNKWLNEIDKTAQSVTGELLHSVVAREFLKHIDLQQFTILELVAQVATYQAKRDSIKAKSSIDSPPTKALIETDKAIRSVLRDVTGVQKAFTDMIVRMGIPRTDDGKEKGTHPHAPALVELPDLSREEVVERTLESLERQAAYIRAKKMERSSTTEGSRKEKTDEGTDSDDGSDRVGVSSGVLGSGGPETP